jgi:hypothetical protein
VLRSSPGVLNREKRRSFIPAEAHASEIVLVNSYSKHVPIGTRLNLSYKVSPYRDPLLDTSKGVFFISVFCSMETAVAALTAGLKPGAGLAPREMAVIRQEYAWFYATSAVRFNGSFDGRGLPIRRGQ